jgi:hypothetical protein
VTEHARETVGTTGAGRSLPGVFFFYDLSPIKVAIAEQRASALHYLTNLCAVIGGVFAVTGLVDSAAYNAPAALARAKRALGKLS